MTPLEDHVARAEATGNFVLQVNQDEAGEIDAPAQPGFVMMLRDGRGRVLLAELSISGDRAGISAVVSAYGAAGYPLDPSLQIFGHQVIVSVD